MVLVRSCKGHLTYKAWLIQGPSHKGLVAVYNGCIYYKIHADSVLSCNIGLIS
jgi:hypothetical protein